ncbi:MAG: hypothetical protein GKS00_16735 [Alphaproteobacteria bacterium]|nr:hypothetical protein [Alphaproteobacteria bacterium]
MTVAIAVIGNTGMNIGATMAGDLALGGHDVRFAPWPDQAECLEAVRAAGGITLMPPSAPSPSARSGLGTPRILTDDPAEAIAGADLVVMDVEPAELEERAAGLIPHLENGQVLFVSTYGYWPALRLAPALRAADKAGVTVAEGTAPPIAAVRTGAEVTPRVIRSEIPVAAFPANRAPDAMRFLPLIMASADLRRSVIETNFENINLMVHPAMALLNVGYFDRAEAKGEPISFYGTGNTVHAGRLAEAFDAERPAVCDAFSVRYRPLLEHIQRLYGGPGGTVYDAVKDSPFYRNIGSLPADIWRSWMALDAPLAQVPFVQLAESAGLRVPLNRGYVHMVDALLGSDSWQDGLTLERLGLAGLSPEGIRAYVETGVPAA